MFNTHARCYVFSSSVCSVVNWIKQIIPQPVVQPPGGVPTEPPPKTSRSSLDKSTSSLYVAIANNAFLILVFSTDPNAFLSSTVLSPPPESLSGISLDTDSKASG